MRSRSHQIGAAAPVDKTHASRFVGPLVLSLLLLIATASACTGSKGSQNPGAQSVERQSDSEYDLAVDLFGKGNPRAALDHAMKAINLNEDNDRAQYFVAVIHSSFCQTNRGLESTECHLSEVEKYTRNALKAKPEFRDAKNFLGQTLVLEKRCKEAITVLEPLTKDPAYVHPHFAWGNLGDAQLCEGQLDAALTSLKNSVAGEPRFCVGYYRLGLVYERKKDLAQSEAAFSSAITADPNCENLQDAWWGRCRVRMQQKNVEWKKDCERCRDISAETPTGKLCVQTLAANP
jgi:Tfp pilus assembly protein PilF